MLVSVFIPLCLEGGPCDAHRAAAQKLLSRLQVKNKTYLNFDFDHNCPKNLACGIYQPNYHLLINTHFLSLFFVSNAYLPSLKCSHLKFLWIRRTQLGGSICSIQAVIHPCYKCIQPAAPSHHW